MGHINRGRNMYLLQFFFNPDIKCLRRVFQKGEHEFDIGSFLKKSLERLIVRSERSINLMIFLIGLNESEKVTIQSCFSYIRIHVAKNVLFF